MKQQQSGFTLIELIMVIVILGILAATAIPKYVDLEAEAQQAAVDGVAGALAASSAINYAGCSAHSHDNSNADCATVDNCDDIDSLMAGGLPSGFTNAAGAADTTNGNSVTCSATKIVGSTTYSKAYVSISAGN